MIAAGPGSGKTTVLVLRALRYVFVDELLPEQVLMTTFTRKAAQELRARLIEWGLLLKAYLAAHSWPGAPAHLQTWLDGIDINRFVTGTLDSLCEEMLTTHRDPADPAPVLVEQFVGDALLMRRGLFASGAHTNPALADYLTAFTFDGSPPRNFGEIASLCRNVVDRLIYDQVNVPAFAAGAPNTAGRAAVVAAHTSYRTFMDNGSRMDFARLEEIFLTRLTQGRLPRFTASVRALLVDEYQDTNPLQEAIYFELARRTNASFTVVGDDDQSLYRFRGATVELYRDFIARFSALVPTVPAPVLQYLVNNYRSTPTIVGFFNSFITNDPAFAPARVQPLKPPIVAQLPSNGIPVLGMFRPNVQALANDLSSFLWDVFRGGGYSKNVGGTPIQIVRHPVGGDFGDAVVLSHTVNEYATRFGSNPPRARLPVLMRERLLTHHNVAVFNPRGHALRDVPVVQQLLGLALDCIDPPNASCSDGVHQTAFSTPPTIRLGNETQLYLRAWRQAGRAFVATNPPPNVPHTLQRFIQAWQTRTSQTSAAWPQEWPVLELMFKLICWLPMLQNDPEGQVYLEAITRCVAQAATYSSYRSSILHGSPPHNENSVKAAIRDIFVPIAESGIDVDEEIMPHVPRDRLPFMTIHQAKGLEYPLVIVDVSSDYLTNRPENAFRRFPTEPSSVHRLENDLAPFCSIGPLRTVRPALARTFDDLIRLYYVAFSRAQSVLVLVGCDPCLRYNATIRHVATGWRSDDTWAWRVPVTGRPPALANNIPMLLI
jgi:DNA helicase-2/ATP-dependent DNA helicase PcrA